MEVREFRAHLWQYETLERIQKVDVARLKAHLQKVDNTPMTHLHKIIRSRDMSLRVLRKRLLEAF